MNRRVKGAQFCFNPFGKSELYELSIKQGIIS